MTAIATNRKAFHDYEVLEKIEAGIELKGSEVKSIRAKHIALADSYALCSAGEIFIHHLHITPYEREGAYVLDPYRKRRLLLHKKEIFRLCSEVDRKSLTLIPLSVYFVKQRVKIELGLCRGRKKFDKRQKIAADETKRRIQALKKVR